MGDERVVEGGVSVRPQVGTEGRWVEYNDFIPSLTHLTKITNSGPKGFFPNNR